MKLWEKYQELVKVKDVSIVDYCQRNGIVYSQFERWYKKNIVSVSLVPLSPSSSLPSPSSESVQQHGVPPSQSVLFPTSQILRIELEFSNGMTIIQKNIDYDKFHDLVEKLEVLC